MRWHRCRQERRRAAAIDLGQLSNALSPVISASSAGSASSDSASCMRRAMSQRARCDAGHAADLRRLQRQPPGVKGLAERQRHRLVAVPAHLDDRRFEAGELAAPARGPPAIRWRESRRPRRRRALGRREADAERARHRARVGVDVDELDLAAGNAAGEPGARQPTVPAPTTRCDRRRAAARPTSPLIAVSRLAASTARAGGHAVRQHVHGRGRHDVAGLVRVEHEDVRPTQIARALARLRRRWRSRT